MSYLIDKADYASNAEISTEVSRLAIPGPSSLEITVCASSRDSLNSQKMYLFYHE